MISKGIAASDYDKTYDPLVSSFSILGMCIGALIAGQIVKNGRRRYLIIFGVIAIFGTAMTLLENVWSIIFGRMIHGICTGIFMTAAPRMLDETVPSHLLGFFGVFTNIYANFGVMIVMLLGIGLP